MTDQKFAVFLPEPIDEQLRLEAAAKAAGSLGLPKEKIAKLLSRPPGFITRPSSRENAQRIAEVLTKAGCKVEPRPWEATPTTATSTAVAAETPVSETPTTQTTSNEASSPQKTSEETFARSDMGARATDSTNTQEATNQPEKSVSSAKKTILGEGTLPKRRFPISLKMLLAALLPLLLFAAVTLYITYRSVNNVATKLLSEVGDNIALTLASDFSDYLNGGGNGQASDLSSDTTTNDAPSNDAPSNDAPSTEPEQVIDSSEVAIATTPDVASTSAENSDVSNNQIAFDSEEAVFYFTKKLRAIENGLHETVAVHYTTAEGVRISGNWEPSITQNANFDSFTSGFKELAEQTLSVSSFGQTEQQRRSNLSERTKLIKGRIPKNTEGKDLTGNFYVIASPLKDNLGTVQVVISEGNIISTALGVIRPILLIALIALSIAIFVVTVLAFAIANNIRRLAKAAEQISLGELDKPISIQSNDETRDLAESFETMRKSLKAAIDRLGRRERGARN